MKYGFLFVSLGILVAWLGLRSGGWFWLLLWPASNFLAIGVSYFLRSPRLYGKRPDGTRARISVLFLWPYLSYLWMIWTLVRIISSENRFDRLDDRTIIGRRLLAAELPAEISNVVDLTAEFSEPAAITGKVNYLVFPILDASTPTVEMLHSMVEKIDSMSGITYVHCAQGHGRTGLVTAALLMFREPRLSSGEAIERIQQARPQVRCNREQMAVLKQLRNLK